MDIREILIYQLKFPELPPVCDWIMTHDEFVEPFLLGY
jgi:hypothetical protein